MSCTPNEMYSFAAAFFLFAFQMWNVGLSGFVDKKNVRKVLRKLFLWDDDDHYYFDMNIIGAFYYVRACVGGIERFKSIEFFFSKRVNFNFPL